MKTILTYLAALVILCGFLLLDGCKDDANPSPVIASFTPASGEVGINVTISGSFFSTIPANNIVKFNEVGATVSAATSTQLVVVIPTSATTGKITVSVGDKTGTSESDFTVIQPAAISSFSPASGQVGSTLTISGSSFETIPSNNIVKINGVDAVVTAATATSLTVTVPDGATTGKVTITVRDKTVTSATNFVINPIVSSFSPTSGKFNTTVTITGNSFDTTPANNIVTFSGVPAVVTAATKTSLTVQLSKGGDSGAITVAVGAGIGVSANLFTYQKVWMTSDFVGSGTDGQQDGTGAAASFSNMTNMAVSSSGKLYVADELTNLIRLVTPDGVVSTIVGTAGLGYQDGSATVAKFYYPVGLTVDAAGNIYVCDSFNQLIRKVDASGNVTTIAGSTGGFNDDTGTNALFNNPHGVAVDADGNLFIADNLNNRIRKINPNGVVTTLAGQSSAGTTDGTGTAASFNNPWSLTIDNNKNLFVTDTQGNTIRKVTPAGVVTTIAGSGASGGTDGIGTSATFNAPTGIAVDQAGDLFVVDHLGSTIRMITPDGKVTTIAGAPGVTGTTNGEGIAARFNVPYSVTANAAGTLLYVSDVSNRKIRKMEYK